MVDALQNVPKQLTNGWWFTERPNSQLMVDALQNVPKQLTNGWCFTECTQTVN